jgi:hypothetical protein
VNPKKGFCGTISTAAVLLLILTVSPVLYSQSVRMQAAPLVLIPLADQDIFGMGAGGSVTFNVDINGFLPWPVSGCSQSLPPPPEAVSRLAATAYLRIGRRCLGGYGPPG